MRFTTALLLLLTGFTTVMTQNSCAARTARHSPQEQRTYIERSTWLGFKDKGETYTILAGSQGEKDAIAELCSTHGAYICHETVDPRKIIQIERTRK